MVPAQLHPHTLDHLHTHRQPGPESTLSLPPYDLHLPSLTTGVVVVIINNYISSSPPPTRPSGKEVIITTKGPSHYETLKKKIKCRERRRRKHHDWGVINIVDTNSFISLAVIYVFMILQVDGMGYTDPIIPSDEVTCPGQCCMNQYSVFLGTVWRGRWTSSRLLKKGPLKRIPMRTNWTTTTDCSELHDTEDMNV